MSKWVRKETVLLEEAGGEKVMTTKAYLQTEVSLNAVRKRRNWWRVRAATHIPVRGS